MLAVFLAAVTVATAPIQQLDTTVAVGEGTRLKVHNMRGEVSLTTWSRNAVRVAADLERGARVPVDLRGSILSVRPRHRHGHSEVDLDITVPEWMSVEVSGTFNDVTIEGVGGEVVVETTHGEIYVVGGRGLISLETVNGEVTLSRAVGEVRIHSTNGEIAVFDVEGELSAETLNGDVELRNIRSARVSVYTINGDVDYDGTIENNGRYSFETHNGDISFNVPPDANASVTVATARGEFESDCPVRISGITGARQFSFSIGNGSAEVELQSFGGTIELSTRGRCWSP